MPTYYGHSLHSARKKIALHPGQLGRSLRIEEVSPEQWLLELPDFLPSFVAKYLLDAWAAAAGQPAFVTSTVAELTGSRARTFREWTIDHAAQFLAESPRSA